MLDENEDVFISALKQDLNKPVQVIFFLLVGTASRAISVFYSHTIILCLARSSDRFLNMPDMPLIAWRNLDNNALSSLHCGFQSGLASSCCLCLTKTRVWCIFLPDLQLANPPTIWKKGAEGYKVKLSKKYTSNCRMCNA
jgi:hypothetical protein